MKTFDHIPAQRPNTPLLDKISGSEDLKRLSLAELPLVCDQLREYLLYSVGQSGGHFGAGLGVVELTVALHYVYNTPDDRLVWDVGHQAYPHKILTGRREEMTSIRQKGGLAAFPSRNESPYDTFGVGHSSTSVGAALGMALGAKMAGANRKVAAIIGDGALTAGMAFEALNHAGHEEANMLVILNDNDMSISENVGGLQKTMAKVFASKTYSHMREGSKKVLGTIPPVWELAKRAEEHMKGMVTPGTLFEEFGLNYVGPVDGHDVVGLVKALTNLRDFNGPQFLHVVTKKGKGFLPAEGEPIKYHAISKIESQTEAIPKTNAPKYSNVFGQWLVDQASADARLVGITPAMKEGSDLIHFAETFPDRYIDVGIAEQHAVTLAAGLACEGQKPVVAIYSTFLQRAYDQLIHDVAIQNLDVLFAIDRAGLVGEDGPTHAGSFDLSFLRCIPNLVIMAPRDENECRKMLSTGFQYQGPAAVRYPRGYGPGIKIDSGLTSLTIGQSETLVIGKDVAILAFGSMVYTCQKPADNLGATLVDMKFIKPLDFKLLDDIARNYKLVVTVEENAIAGGAGSGVSEYFRVNNHQIDCMHLGITDLFTEQGKPSDLLAGLGLDAAGIQKQIEIRLG